MSESKSKLPNDYKGQAIGSFKVICGDRCAINTEWWPFTIITWAIILIPSMA